MTTTATFACGHTVTYERLLPPRNASRRKCPDCHRRESEAMGRAHSEMVRQDKIAMRQRQRAQSAHEYGREHDREVCPLCQAGASFFPREGTAA